MPLLEIVNEEYMNAMRACVVNWLYNGEPDGYTVHTSKLAAQLYASVIRQEMPELKPNGFITVKTRQPAADVLDLHLGTTEVAVLGVGERFDAEWLLEEHLPAVAA